MNKFALVVWSSITATSGPEVRTAVRSTRVSPAYRPVPGAGVEQPPGAMESRARHAHQQSIEPARATKAAEWQSEMKP